MRRRTLFGGLVSGLFAGAAVRSAEKRIEPDGGEIPRRPFGKTGVELTVIGLASGRFPLIAPEEAVALTRKAVELGINYFDTAHSYGDGRSEEAYGKVLPGSARKSSSPRRQLTEPARGLRPNSTSRSKRLRTDYVDLWQVHAIQDKADVPGSLPRRGDRGLRSCQEGGQVPVHRLHRSSRPRGPPGDAPDLRPVGLDPDAAACRRSVVPELRKEGAAHGRRTGIGIQGMKNFANAKLLQGFSVKECLSYVLSLPIHCTAVGCTTLGQLEDDVRIARDMQPLDAGQLAALRPAPSRSRGRGSRIGSGTSSQL